MKLSLKLTIEGVKAFVQLLQIALRVSQFNVHMLVQGESKAEEVQRQQYYKALRQHQLSSSPHPPPEAPTKKMTRRVEFLSWSSSAGQSAIDGPIVYSHLQKNIKYGDAPSPKELFKSYNVVYGVEAPNNNFFRSVGIDANNFTALSKSLTFNLINPLALLQHLITICGPDPKDSDPKEYDTCTITLVERDQALELFVIASNSTNPRSVTLSQYHPVKLIRAFPNPDSEHDIEAATTFLNCRARAFNTGNLISWYSFRFIDPPNPSQNLELSQYTKKGPFLAFLRRFIEISPQSTSTSDRLGTNNDQAGAVASRDATIEFKFESQAIARQADRYKGSKVIPGITTLSLKLRGSLVSSETAISHVEAFIDPQAIAWIRRLVAHEKSKKRTQLNQTKHKKNVMGDDDDDDFSMQAGTETTQDDDDDDKDDFDTHNNQRTSEELKSYSEALFTADVKISALRVLCNLRKDEGPLKLEFHEGLLRAWVKSGAPDDYQRVSLFATPIRSHLSDVPSPDDDDDDDGE